MMKTLENGQDADIREAQLRIRQLERTIEDLRKSQRLKRNKSNEPEHFLIDKSGRRKKVAVFDDATSTPTRTPKQGKHAALSKFSAPSFVSASQSKFVQ